MKNPVIHMTHSPRTGRPLETLCGLPAGVTGRVHYTLLTDLTDLTDCGNCRRTTAWLESRVASLMDEHGMDEDEARDFLRV